MKIIIEEYNLNLTLKEAENLYNQLKIIFDKKDPAPVPWSTPKYPTEPYVWYTKTDTKPISQFVSGLTKING